MCEYIYRISLEKDGTKAIGELTRIYYQKTKEFPFFETTEEKILFDPFYILGDLRNQLIPYKIHMKRSDYFKRESYLFSNYDCEYGFNKPLNIDDKKNYSSLLKSLNELIESNSKIKEQELERLIKECHIHLECSVSIKHKNNIRQIDRINQQEEKYIPLIYNFGRTNREIDRRTYLEKTHVFSYKCMTMTDVIFSIIHFWVIHDYRFIICPLCQKIYISVPTRGKHSGCERKAEISIDNFLTEKRKEKFRQEDQTCKTTLKFIKNYFRDIRKDILKNLNEKHSVKIENYEASDNTYKKFNEYYKKYNEQLNSCSCYNNILIMNTILSKYRKIWYYDDRKKFIEELQNLEREIQIDTPIHQNRTIHINYSKSSEYSS